MKPKKMKKEQAVELAKIISEQFCITNHKEWVDFMQGSHPKVVHFLPFEQAREFVQKLNLKSHKEWKLYCDENHIVDIPSNPAKHYKNGWLSWGDFIGTGHKIPSKFRPFKEAVIYVRSLGINDCKEWQEFCDIGDKPKDIPHSPQKIYKDEWQGWNHFFGIGLYRQEFYIKTPDDELLEEIENDIVWDIHNIGGMIEVFREQSDTDEEILEEYKDEPKLFLNGLKKYLKKYPREKE